MKIKASFFIIFTALLLSGCGAGQTTTAKAESSQAIETSTTNTTGSEHLKYGVPSTSGKLIVRTGYALLHDKKIKEPRWVSYHLTAENLNATQLKRSNVFAPDPELMPGERAELSDYKGSGFDRGHMTPNADQSWSALTMKECFYLSNMCPQIHSFNAGKWEDLEKRVRSFTKKHGEAWIVCGPVINDVPTEIVTIGANRLPVPVGFYKIIIYETKEGTKAVGYEMPHVNISGDLKEFIVDIRGIEKRTGLNFLSSLPQSVQDKLELILPASPELLN